MLLTGFAAKHFGHCQIYFLRPDVTLNEWQGGVPTCQLACWLSNCINKVYRCNSQTQSWRKRSKLMTSRWLQLLVLTHLSIQVAVPLNSGREIIKNSSIWLSMHRGRNSSYAPGFNIRLNAVLPCKSMGNDLFFLASHQVVSRGTAVLASVFSSES